MQSLEGRVTLFLAQHRLQELSPLDISKALFPEEFSKRSEDVLFALQEIQRKEFLFRKNIVSSATRINGTTTYSMRPKITLSQTDMDFQNWLHASKLMLYNEQAFEFEINLDFSRKDAGLLTVLMDLEHFIVPYFLLSQNVYKEQYQMSKIGQLFRYLRSHSILSSNDALVVPNFGIGLSVRSIDLAAKNIELLEILWKAALLELKYSSDMLYKRIWKKYGPTTTAEKTKLFVLIDTTRKALKKTEYDIVTSGGRDTAHFSLTKRE